MKSVEQLIHDMQQLANDAHKAGAWTVTVPVTDFCSVAMLLEAVRPAVPARGPKIPPMKSHFVVEATLPAPMPGGHYVYHYQAKTVEGRKYSGVMQMAFRVSGPAEYENFKDVVGQGLGEEIGSVLSLSYLGRAYE